MLDVNDFSFFEDQNTVDFKGFITKTASYWKWFLLGIAISFFIAYQINLRKQEVYSLESTIAVKEQDNPLFTSGTSLIFDWGGTSDQVQNVASTLKSRSHNELVVSKLNYFIDYQKKQKYFNEDVYGYCPFEIQLDKSKNQIYKNSFAIKFINANEFELIFDDKQATINVNNYSTNTVKTIAFTKPSKQKYKFNEVINLPYFSAIVAKVPFEGSYINEEYTIQLNSIDDVVGRYRGISVVIDDQAASILKLSLIDNNKRRIVDYLNATVEVLMQRQLDGKNLFADNTITFIDETLRKMEGELNNTNKELKDFTRGKNVLQLQTGGADLQSELSMLDMSNDEINRKINYYNTLTRYLNNSTDYSKLPAPSVAGIDDPNIVFNVSNLIALSVERSEMAYTIKSEIMFNDIDNKISSVKRVLLENIRAAKAAIQMQASQVRNKLYTAEGKVSQLPDDSQEYTQIMRKYDLNRTIYETYLQKRSEASIVKAANLSDIQFIDPAKDVGSGLIGSRNNTNYVIALLIGLLLPLLIISILFYLNNTIQNIDDIASLSSIPVIGTIGINNEKSNLAVFEKPKSGLAEGFRSIRSSLQFLYKKQNINGTKIIMITSSVGGEGKSFCSLNLGTVLALSGKKTIIVGLDLRKPKLFQDFEIKNDIGVVNYLIQANTLDQISNKTKIPNLDIISSGPIPPNPSELIMSENMGKLIDELKLQYDYIILDTPPIGLVTDAVELTSFADVTLYVSRQNVTKKSMISLLNNKVKRGEIKNVSIILNGFENKAKYGTYYGYDSYSYGYYDTDSKPESKTEKILKSLKKWKK